MLGNAKHQLADILDRKLIEEAMPALAGGKSVTIETPICNVNRTTGTMLSGELAKRYGYEGLPDDTITVNLTGTAGQSFAAFLAKGITLRPRRRGQ